MSETQSAELEDFLIRKVPGLPEEERHALLRDWTVVKHLRRGDVLGGNLPDTHLYFVHKGLVKICRMLEEREILLEFGYRGSCVFNLPVFFDERKSGYYLEALQNTVLRGIRKEAFYRHVRGSQVLSAFWEKTMAGLLQELVERESEILCPTPALRYERLMRRRPELLRHVPKKYLARYLGTSAETLSRL